MKKFYAVFLALFMLSAGNLALANDGGSEGSDETTQAPKDEGC